VVARHAHTASICYFLFETEIGDIMLFHTHTPLEPLLQRVEFRYWADKSIPRCVTRCRL
jgi:hypothetical protein